ncbi:invasion associated locus B family protein [Allomesorhizobium alhagi]|uniref:Invasion associated locus B family protein n=1 Tax=Mesorhizobium alhagi CCNWXJ12-2 TaxID=1107882 RepID=H0HYJ1_9HYPH|nr:invasion associated locus B family protein [Mesorhizobium alhagi]EHK54200.1 invasion associated locus B family protein [Mesorhizobium alhagi CCNWXJ12-2]
MRLRHKTVSACGAIVFSLLSAASAQQQVAALPNGASSLREVYQDWSVACAIRENAKICSLSQDQVQQNGQRLLAVEVHRSADGSATATLLLPFGILLDSGVTPQIDDQPPLSPLRFRTCQPTGCLAVFSIDPAMLGKMREGSVLKLNVTTAAETQLTFPVSLRGLTVALDRMAALSTR